MSFRFMRMLVFFDLPTETYKNRKDYRKFKKYLLNEGFIMMQESVYSKLALNASVMNSVIDKMERNKPNGGIVQVLLVTEKQFTGINTIVGESFSNSLDSTERLIII